MRDVIHKRRPTRRRFRTPAQSRYPRFERVTGVMLCLVLVLALAATPSAAMGTTRDRADSVSSDSVASSTSVTDVADEASHDEMSDEAISGIPAASDSAGDVGGSSPDGSVAAQGQPDAPLSAMGDGAIDLNAKWRGQGGGTSQPLTITEGGTYALTADLDVGGWITIDAPDADVTIDLGTFHLTARMPSYDYLIGTRRCKSLTITGGRPFAGIAVEGQVDPGEQLVVTEGRLAHLIDSSCENLVVRDVSMALKGHQDYTQLEKLDACGVYVTRGSAVLDNCSVFVDHSNQTLSTATRKLEGHPRAVYAGNQVASVELNHCDLEVQASPVVERPSGETHKLTSFDNAYGVYSGGNASITVRGGAIVVNAPRSTATGVYAARISVEPGSVDPTVLERYANQEARASAASAAELSLTCDGKEGAFGLRTDNSRGMSLNAPLRCAIGKASYPAYGAALVTSVEDGVVFGGSFAGEGVTVLAGNALEYANGDGQRFGVFSDGLDASTCQAIAASLANGLAGGACGVSSDDRGLFFRLDSASAPVVIMGADGSETPCATVTEALRRQKNGETVQLRRDVAAVTIDADTVPAQLGKRELSIDLNGHVMAGLAVNTGDNVRAFSSTGDRQAAIRGYQLVNRACITYGGTGDLTLENVRVEGVSQGREGTALRVSGSGAVTLDSVDMQMTSQAVFSRGVYQEGGDADITVRRSTIHACSDVSGVNVRGVVATTTKGMLAISDSAVEADALDGSTGAVECAGALEATGSTLSASTRQVSNDVFGARLTNDDAKASLRDMNVSALCEQDATGGSYWCLMGGSAQVPCKSSWTLDGACAFESALDTHIRFLSAPLTVGDSFGSAHVIRVLGEQLENDRALSYEPSIDAVARGYLDAFAPVEGSLREGWILHQDQAGSAVWWRDPVMRNERTHSSYPSLARAIAEARSGDTLKLLADADEHEIAELPAAVTLDLGGHALSIDVPPSSAASLDAAALSLAGRGTYEVRNGTLAVRLAPSTLLFSTDVSFAAIRASEGSDLRLSGVELSLAIDDTPAGTGTMQVQAIAATDSSVALVDGSTVRVVASGSQAVQAQGIAYASNGKDPSLLVDAGSSVIVQNDSQRQQKGDISYPSKPSVRYLKANLMRFYPEEGTALYAEIQSLFKRYAKADVPDDRDGHVYDTYLYYAAPLTLSDGTYVWAYSDPVAPEDVGKLDKIKASVFYSQSYYDIVPNAQAVALTGSMPEARIAGALEANSPSGDASGVYAELTQEDAQKGREDIVVERGARIVASASDASYRKQTGHLDLRDIFKLDVSSKVIYPAYYYNYDYREVEFAHAEGQCLAGPSASCVQVRDASSLAQGQVDAAAREVVTNILAPRQTAPVAVTPGEVTVTFDNLRAADGTMLASQSRVQGYGTTLASGGAIPTASDYIWAGLTYRFVGWTTTQSGQSAKTWDEEHIGDLKLDETTDALKGNISIRAVYVPVAPGQHLASFKVDGYVEAHGVYEGQSPDYVYAVRSATASIPTKQHGKAGMIYGFTGWSDETGGDARLYGGTLPPATRDCSYVATFSERPGRYNVYYYGMLPVREGMQYTYAIKQVYGGSNGLDKANEVARQGDVRYDDAHVYSFIGWSPRQSDIEPYYGLEPPMVPIPTAAGAQDDLTKQSSVYAIYEVRERKVPVDFYVDGQLYAQADDVPTTTTVNGAFDATGVSRPADKGEDLPFRGWSLSPDDSNYIRGSIKTLATLTQGEDPVTLYAVFGKDAVEELPNASGSDADDGGSASVALFGSRNAPRAKTPIASAGGLAANANPNASGLAPQDSLGDGQSDASDGPSQQVDALNMSLVAFVLIAFVLAGFALWWIARVRRDRKLDKEDDFYEPASSAHSGEQVVF